MKSNFFKILDKKIFSSEQIIFSKSKIKKFVKNLIFQELNSLPKNKRGEFFEKIVCDFFEYMHFELTRTKKTRDFGLDGIIKTELEPFGKLKIGLQIKYKKINSIDVDSFLQALNFAEIRLGALVCKDAARLDKYTISSKLKAMLFGEEKGIKVKEKLELKPVFILKFEDVLNIFSEEVRYKVQAIYKR